MELLDIWNWIQQNGILTAVITGIVALLFNQRQKSIERFYSQSGETLEKILEPMYYSLKEIKNEEDENHKMVLIEKFFEEYSGKKGKLSKLRNILLIDQILNTEDCFREYILNKNSENRKKLFYKMRMLDQAVNKEYRSIFVNLNKNYNWYKVLFRTNYILSAVFVFVRWFKETLAFFVGASAFAFIPLLYDKYLGEQVLGNWLEVNKLIFGLSCSALYIFWIIHYFLLKDTMQRKDEISLFQEWFDKTKLGKWTNKNVWGKIGNWNVERRARRVRNDEDV